MEPLGLVVIVWGYCTSLIRKYLPVDTTSKVWVMVTLLTGKGLPTCVQFSRLLEDSKTKVGVLICHVCNNP